MIRVPQWHLGGDTWWDVRAEAGTHDGGMRRRWLLPGSRITVWGCDGFHQRRRRQLPLSPVPSGSQTRQGQYGWSSGPHRARLAAGAGSCHRHSMLARRPVGANHTRILPDHLTDRRRPDGQAAPALQLSLWAFWTEQQTEPGTTAHPRPSTRRPLAEVNRVTRACWATLDHPCKREEKNWPVIAMTAAEADYAKAQLSKTDLARCRFNLERGGRS